MFYRFFFTLMIVSLAGCNSSPIGTACTEIGCSDAITLNLRAETGGLRTGHYDLELVPANDSLIACSFEFSTDPGLCSSGACIPSSDCPMLFASLPGEDPGVSLVYTAFASEISFTVKRDSNVIFESTFTPDFEEFMPNGPFCPPTCQVFETTFIID